MSLQMLNTNVDKRFWLLMFTIMATHSWHTVEAIWNQFKAMIDIHLKKCVTDTLSKMDPRDASASKYGWCDTAEGAGESSVMIFGGNPPLLDAHQPFPHSAHIVEGWSYIAEGGEWCVTLPSVALCTRGPPSCGALWVKLFSIRIAKKISFLVVVGTSAALSRRRR